MKLIVEMRTEVGSTDRRVGHAKRLSREIAVLRDLDDDVAIASVSKILGKEDAYFDSMVKKFTMLAELNEIP